MRLWRNKPNGGLLQVICDYDAPVRSLCYSSGGDFLLTASDNGRLDVFRSLQGDHSHVTSIDAHKTRINECRFSPDDKYMATGSKDLSVKLWDFGSGKLVSTQRTETP